MFSRQFSFFDIKIVWDDPTSAPSALRWASHLRLAPRSSSSERRGGPQTASLPVVIGAGSHPFPFRTRKLSLLPPMVLHGKLCGRVGRCRHYLEARCEPSHRAFFCPAAATYDHERAPAAAASERSE